MLSSTATSSSYSNNSIISDSSLFHRNPNSQELKKRRKKTSQFHSNPNIKNKLLYNENLNQNYSLNINKNNSFNTNNNQFIMKSKKIRNKKENQNEYIKNSRVQEVPVPTNSRRSLRSVESSEISSNNLTCSELETSSNHSHSEVRLQRRKLIKCVLREDVDLLVSTTFVLKFIFFKQFMNT